MTRIVRVFLAVFSLQFLLISAATISLAQVDPTKALIGRWEGQVQISGSNMGRTVIINSVKAKGEGEWVARGRYSIAGHESKEGGGQAMSVSLKDNEIYVEFVVGGSNNPVKLKLVGETKLEGTVDFGGRTRERQIVLEKVAPKAGEVK